MTCLESCILVMVIGFTVLAVSVGIIQKLFDESRKRSERAAEAVSKAGNELVNGGMKIVEAIVKREEEIHKSRMEEFERRTKGEFEV